MRAMERYGAVSFSGETKAGPFYEQIQSHRKTRTLRERRKDNQPHVKPGYLFSMYWKMRTRKEKQKDLPIYYIGMALCIAYEAVKIVDYWNDEEFAKSDGFQDLDEFRDNWYPGWRNIPWLDEVLKAYYSLKEQKAAKGVIMNWGRRQGKNTIVKFLDLEYMMIHFRYLKGCGITVCSYNTANAREHGHNLCLKKEPTGACLAYTL